MYERFWTYISLVFFMTFTGFYATAQEGDNLLPNGSFEEIFDKNGVENTNANNGVPAAATDWKQWINGGDELITEVVDHRDLPMGVADGDYAIRITANGAGSGLFMYYLTGNQETVTYSAWIYVLEGKAGIAVGSNAQGFDWVKTTKTNQWEFLEITLDGAKIPEEVLIYSQDGPADLYADAAWVNYGDESTNPVTSLKVKAVDSKGKLAVAWAGIKLHCSGNRFQD